MQSKVNVILILLAGLYFWSTFTTHEPNEHPYGLLSIMPVIVAVGLAFITRRAVLSLMCGLLSAGLILKSNPIEGIYMVLDPFILDSLASRDNLKVIFFSISVGVVVEILRSTGSTQALVSRFAMFARSRTAAMSSTWLAGLTVFFDDYANCLIVGSSMTTVTDRAGVSREKLAYIVDSTAAPVATLALISTWIGYEVSLMDQALTAAGQDINAYGFFIDGIGYRFYPILALVFGLTICLSGRDFGPMLKAERKAQAAFRSQDTAIEESTGNLWISVFAIGGLIGMTAYDLYAQGIASLGRSAALFEIIGEADGYDAMLKGALFSLTIAFVMGLWDKHAVKDLLSASKIGTGRLVEALMVLVCAWGMGAAIGELKAAAFLVDILNNTLSVNWYPALVFILAAIVAFATGTSFGTMGTLMPLAIPLCIESGASMEITLAVSAAVLSGATWGDHCSPISDTTVLSSAGTGCDHVAHVQTQLPYAIAAGITALVCCSIPVGFGVHWLPCLVIGAAACVLMPFVLGKPVKT